MQRLTERTFYGVSTLSGLPIRKLFQACQALAKDHFRADKVNELQREVAPLREFVVPEVLEVHVTPSEEVRMVPEAPTTKKVPFA